MLVALINTMSKSNGYNAGMFTTPAYNAVWAVSWRCKNLQRQRCKYSAKKRRIGFTTLGPAL
jgi:hypothetical protein